MDCASRQALTGRVGGRTRVAAILLLVVAGDLACRADRAESPVFVAFDRIEITGPSKIDPGQTVSLAIRAFNSSGRLLPVPQVTWSSGDPKVATVTPAGVVTGVAIGVTTVRARTASLSASVLMGVKLDPRKMRLAVMPRGEFGDTIQMAPGSTVQMRSYLYSVDSEYVSPVHASWASARPDLATVSADGLVTAVQEGIAEILASGGPQIVSRYIRVAPSPGTVSMRFVHAGDGVQPVTLHQNVGAPLTLAFGDVREETVPAGTVQVTIDGYPLYLPAHYDPSVFELQEFTGFIPAETRATIVVVGGPGNTNLVGPVALAPLWDWNKPVPMDSVRVRVVLATIGGYNVYLVPPGQQKGTAFLQGCYLDWPYGVTDYAARSAREFDIVLEPKSWTATSYEAGRFRVTPQPGHATTYIIAGKTESALQVWTFVDR